MIASAIGMPTSRRGVAAFDQIQDRLAALGLAPYMPQLRYTGSYNIGMAYDPVARGLARSSRNGAYGWTAEMTAEVRRFEGPMVFAYGGYYYRTAPQTLRWRMSDGSERSQDEMSDEALRVVLADSLVWLLNAGVVQPWIFVDELPHPGTAGDVSVWGWTQGVEDRGLKFITAAQTAGWPIVFAAPPAAAVEYWYGKGIRPAVWCVVDPGPDTDTAKPFTAMLARVLPLVRGTPVWLYNSTHFDGLAERIAALNPHTKGGYLHWSALWTKAPLFDDDGNPTPLLDKLKIELARDVPAPPPPPPPDPKPDLAEQVESLRAEVTELRQRIEVLEDTQEPPAPPQPSQPVDLALLYSTIVNDWQNAISTVSEYPQAIIPAELCTITSDSRGATYTFGATPLAYLREQGVEPWLYVSPWWLWTASGFGKGEWFRAMQVRLADEEAAWLLNWRQRVPVYSGKMHVADPRNKRYAARLADAMISLPHTDLFIDNAFYYQGAYHAWAVPDAEWFGATSTFYDRLRANGKRVILNGGWEMLDPTGEWVFPYREHCDGVAIEIPAAFRPAPDQRVNVCDYTPLETDILEGIIAAWKGFDKQVFVIAPYQQEGEPASANSTFDSLAHHRSFWRALAARTRSSVSAQTGYTTVPVLES